MNNIIMPAIERWKESLDTLLIVVSPTVVSLY